MSTVEIKFKDLRDAVTALNKSGLLPKNAEGQEVLIELVGQTKEDALKEFMQIVKNIPDNAEGKFPGEKVILDFYNSVLDAEEKADGKAKNAAGETKTQPDGPKKPSATTRIIQIVVDNPGISLVDVKAILQKEGYPQISENTLYSYRKDTMKIVAYIESKGTK